eukprot:gene27175-7132_t
MMKLLAVANRTRNVLFVLFDEEEIGLIGSREFATWLLDVSNFNHSDRGESVATAVHSVHTVDQMGWDSDGDRAFELELPFKGCADLYRRAASTSAAAEDWRVQITIHETKVASTDHSSFRKKGFPAVGLTEEYVNGDTTPHWHKSTDTYNTVNFEYLAAVTTVVSEVFKELIAERE